MGVVLALTTAVNVFLIPVTSDGAIAAFDGLKYGVGAEQTPRESISGHHPLFHLVLNGVTLVTRSLGIAYPGHVAARLVAGFSAGLFILLVLCAAGRSRWRAGACFALVAVVSRFFLIDSGVGESTIPGYVAAIWVFIEALRPAPVRWRLVLALTTALCIRQDNILILPGLLATLWASIPPPRRGKEITAILAVSGLMTAVFYVGCWLVATGGKPGLFAYLTELAADGPWEGPSGFHIGRMLLHVDALAAALVGRTWPIDSPNLWLGPAWIGGVALAALLLRGDGAPMRKAIVLVGVTVIARLTFFTWFEAVNPEWALFVVCAAAWLGARAARGAPVHGRTARVLGAALLVAIAGVVLALHARETAGLRRTSFVDDIDRVRRSCPSCDVIAHGPRVEMACKVLGFPFQGVADTSNPVADLDHIVWRIGQTKRDTVIIFDRAMLTLDPYTSGRARRNPLFLDDMDSTPRIEVHKVDGRAFAVTYHPNM